VRSFARTGHLCCVRLSPSAASAAFGDIDVVAARDGTRRASSPPLQPLRSCSWFCEHLVGAKRGSASLVPCSEKISIADCSCKCIAGAGAWLGM
jgi:hypothetical protein